jgi:uncharacterized membrane protein
MKTTSRSLTVIILAALIGCSQGTPGGPGTTKVTANKPVMGQADETFRLSVPVLSSSVQQGETMEATIGIERGTNFQEDVTLKFADLPAGVTIDPAEPQIKHGDKETKVVVKAGDDAAVGDYKIKVLGHPTKGTDAEVDFKVTVAARDNFSLSLPLLSTEIKQGEKKSVAFDIKRNKSFDQDVTLSFGELPKGVTVDASNPVIKSGETESQVAFTAASDAALGDFTIKVTGHPTKGTDTTGDFKLTVTK